MRHRGFNGNWYIKVNILLCRRGTLRASLKWIIDLNCYAGLRRCLPQGSRLAGLTFFWFSKTSVTNVVDLKRYLEHGWRFLDVIEDPSSRRCTYQFINTTELIFSVSLYHTNTYTPSHRKHDPTSPRLTITLLMINHSSGYCHATNFSMFHYCSSKYKRLDYRNYVSLDTLLK